MGTKPICKVRRGQVWFLVDPKAEYDGSILGKNRPVLVVSNNYCNENSPVIHVVPITTANKSPLPTHVHFNDGKFEQTILCEQLKPVKESLFYDKTYYKYSLSDDVMQQVDEAIAVQLGLSLVMPNSERFWKSVEQMIRLKVKEAVRCARVEALDIGKISCLITRAADECVNEPEVPATPAPTIAITAPEPPVVRRSKNRWTLEDKRRFVRMYDEKGPQAAAQEFNIKLGSAYRLKWQFEKEEHDGKTE